MAFGPTQNYDDATLGVWRPRPVLAVCVRLALLTLPVLLAIGLGWAAVRWLPPQRLGVNPWVWLTIEVACSTALLVVIGRQVRRLLPLTALLRLTSYFPDRAPSRLAVARRTYSSAVLRERLARAERESEPTGVVDQCAFGLLELLGSLNAHDRTTFGHSERVQAYAALIGTELGLPPAQAAMLSWAALLHDIGKLHVPTEILNKPSGPTRAEWQVLAKHPTDGATLAAPLRDWLGPWLSAIEQHHERWDGGGYPLGLAGTEIGHAARIVAVADAYDVITTARSYKKPLSVSAARAELARCAGQQFDPEVVRAFLAIGLGRLRIVAGPLSVVSALPALRSMPMPDLGSAVSSVIHAAPGIGAATTATVVAAALTVADPLLLPSSPQSDVVQTAEVRAVADSWQDEVDPTHAPGPADLHAWLAVTSSGPGHGSARGPAASAAPNATDRPDHVAGVPGSRSPQAGVPAQPDVPALPSSPARAGVPADNPLPHARIPSHDNNSDNPCPHARIPSQGAASSPTDR